MYLTYLPTNWNHDVTWRIIDGSYGYGWMVIIVTIRPSGEQIAQCPNMSHNNSVSYVYTFIYTYIQ